MRRPNGRCSLSGLVWPSPDSTSSHLQISDGVRIRQRQLLVEALATTPFRHQERDFLPQRLRSEIGRHSFPENERLEGRIGKARRSWAFSARLHMAAENVNAWWWMQPPSNRSHPVKFPDNRENTGNFARFGPVI